jgi:hypothetical protein
MFLAGLGGDDDTQSTSATTAAVLSMPTDGRRGKGVWTDCEERRP